MDILKLLKAYRNGASIEVLKGNEWVPHNGAFDFVFFQYRIARSKE